MNAIIVYWFGKKKNNLSNTEKIKFLIFIGIGRVFNILLHI